MPKRKYPKWFSPFSAPTLPPKPKPPEKEVNSYIVIKTWTVDCNVALPMAEFLSVDADHFEIDYTESPPYQITALKLQKKQNSNYERQLKDYKISLQIWEADIIETRKQRKEWKDLHAKWKKEQDDAEMAHDLKTLSVLKKKYPQEFREGYGS
jgi:hypothetical protein